MNFKQQPVVIVKDDMGNTIRISKNNPEYAHVRLSQERSWLSAMGWFTKRNVTTLIHGKTDEIKASGIGRMKKLPGNIRIVEQLTPFNESNPDRDLKYAGDTGVVCCQDGQPIYRRTFYDATAQLEDELIAHTNSDAIREANSNSVNLESDEIDDTTSMISHEDDSDEEQADPNQLDLEDAIAAAKAKGSEDNEEETIIEEEEVEEEIEVEDNNVFNL